MPRSATREPAAISASLHRARSARPRSRAIRRSRRSARTILTRWTPRSSITLDAQYSDSASITTGPSFESAYVNTSAGYSRQLTRRLSLTANVRYTNPFKSVGDLRRISTAASASAIGSDDDMNSQSNAFEAQEESSIGALLPHIPAIIWSRKWLVIVPTVIGLIIGITTAFLLPVTYQSKAVLLVEAPMLPEDVASDVSGMEIIDQRMARIREQVLSRSQLIDLINRNSLYQAELRIKTFSEVIEDDAQRHLDPARDRQYPDRQPTEHDRLQHQLQLFRAGQGPGRAAVDHAADPADQLQHPVRAGRQHGSSSSTTRPGNCSCRSPTWKARSWRPSSRTGLRWPARAAVSTARRR